MDVTGQIAVYAPPEAVAAVLRDPERLRAMMPACTALTPKGNGQYDARFARAVGPVTVRLDGAISIEEMAAGRSFVLSAKVGSLLSGSIRARFEVRLSDGPPGGTQVTWDGTAELSGAVARIAPTVAPDYGARGARAVFSRLRALAEAPPGA